MSPNNPVLLTHASGHASFANAKAMELSGITRTTTNPAGGEILKDAKGNPTGLLRETASRLIRRGAGEPAPTAEERARATAASSSSPAQEALSKGITTFQDAGSSFETIDRMKAMVDEGKLNVRLWMMVRAGNKIAAQKLAQYRMIDYGNGHLTVRAIKQSIDGALGSRGAWLLEPYSDKPDSTGLNTTPVDEIREAADLAMQHGYQLCVHAIGDRANRETLNIFEEAFKANPDKKDLRWRVEHAQHLHPADIPRFGAARRHRVDAGRPLHVGRALRARAARAEARRGRRLRLAEADEVRRRRHQRHRRAGRGRRSDRELLRDREPQAEGRQRLLSRSAHEPHGGAASPTRSTAPTRRSRRDRRAR